MYQGALFLKSLKFAIQEKFDMIFILSAKYGLLELTSIISPYEKTLNTFSKKDLKSWSDMVKTQIEEKKLSGEFWFFCGERYHMFFQGRKPLSGLSLGNQLKWLNQKTKRKGKLLL
jgi:hypothetical protein